MEANFTLIIEALRRNNPSEARRQVSVLLRNPNLGQEHWGALYSTLNLTSKAIEGRGHLMHADTMKAWSAHHTEKALEGLRKHLGLAEFEPLPAPALLEEKEGFSHIMDALLANDPFEARKWVGELMLRGRLSDANRPLINDILYLTGVGITGRGDYMYADTRKAWLAYYTAQALDRLRAHFGINEVVQFPMTEAAAGTTTVAA